jgi:hypothetical protein
MASNHLYILSKHLFAEKTGEKLNGVAMTRIHEVCGVSRQTVINWGASDIVPQESTLDKFCTVTGFDRATIEAVINLPWDVTVDENNFYLAAKARDISQIKTLGMSPNFLPSQLISIIEELSPDHLVRKFWEFRNKGDDYLTPVDRFIFFAGSARILYQDLLDWIKCSPGDVKISIDYLISIMDNLQVPDSERVLFLTRPKTV